MNSEVLSSHAVETALIFEKFTILHLDGGAKEMAD
jgi:hypothetical protein